MKMHKNGFTVVELLVAMVIVVVLASIAYPSYVSLLRKARRAEAATELASLAHAQERVYARYRNYSSVVNGPEECAGQGCGLARSSSLSENDYYVLSANGNATSYTLTATAHGSQVEDTDCKTMTIDNVGIKAARSASGQDLTEKCW